MAMHQLNLDGARGMVSSLGGNVDFSAPDTVNVVFYTKAVHDPVESRQRGRIWHKSTTYVRIQHPGEKDYVDRPVKEEDIAKMRWPRQWDQYLRAQEQVPDGTPVDCLFPDQPEISANMHSIAIHTVQQLAGLTAHGVQTIGMGGTQWQQKAKNFLAASNGGAAFHRLAAENDKLKNSLETQANQISLMKAQIDRLSAQREQGIPAAMMAPTALATVAQVHAMEQPAFKPMAELSDEPLFVEIDDGSGMEGPSIEPSQSNDIVRRPRGRPPGSRNHEGT